MSTSALNRRLSFVERIVNLPKRDSQQVRICLVALGKSHDEAIIRHRLEDGRVPVVVVSSKKAAS